MALLAVRLCPIKGQAGSLGGFRGGSEQATGSFSAEHVVAFASETYTFTVRHTHIYIYILYTYLQTHLHISISVYQSINLI